MKNQKLSLIEKRKKKEQKKKKKKQKKSKKKRKKEKKKRKEMADTKRPIYCNMRVMSCFVSAPLHVQCKYLSFPSFVFVVGDTGLVSHNILNSSGRC